LIVATAVRRDLGFVNRSAGGVGHGAAANDDAVSGCRWRVGNAASLTRSDVARAQFWPAGQI